MKKRSIKRISILLLLSLSLALIPSFSQTAEAYSPYSYWAKYKITYKWKVVKKKKKPVLSSKKLSFTPSEIRSITLNNATAKKVKWSSSNKKIATVKKSGKWCDITAKKPGKVVITAKYKGKKYKCKVTITKKQSNAFYSWTNKNNETLLFKTDAADPYLDETPTWFMYKNDEGYSKRMEMGFDSNIYPLTLTCEIGDTSIIDCNWEDCGEELGWVLSFEPQQAGSTYLRISNSYNSQTMYFPIVVKDDYVPQSEGYLRLLNSSCYIHDFEEESTITLQGSKDVSDIGYTLYQDGTGCIVDKIEKKDGLFVAHVKATKCGTTKIRFYDSNHKYKYVDATVTARVPNKIISAEVNDLEMIVGDTNTITVSTDLGSDIVVETDNNNVSATKKGWIDNGTSCKLEIKAKTEGDTLITIRDAENSSVFTTVNVKVGIIETEGITITNKRSSITPSITSSARIINNNYTFKASVSPDNATYKQVTWEVSDPDIATIDSTGFFTAIRSGTVVVKASTYNGLSDEFTIKITIR